MNEQELTTFRENRKPSPAIQRFDISSLHCYGCAHSSSSLPAPGGPSGERPCCSCIRNKDLEQEVHSNPVAQEADTVVIGDDGHARVFNPFSGALYNGAPTVYFPMDNYVTLDQHEQQEFMSRHPEYRAAVSFHGDKLTVVKD